MPTYLLSYRYPHNYEGPADPMAAWNTWFENLGTSLVDRGNPVLSETRTLGNTSDGTVLGGYTLVTADDLRAAVTLAKDCPALQGGGGVEVGELTILNRGARLATDDPA